ncbi:TIGR01777 family oxidoreductase [Larsenimonas salina]|uniref:TIGR01777 family oxidoreductase n=1 Tax=Larsenimonas salina TaxID=1295565 RepID=UPI002073B335|nr:TIGR01777 family oxidoreductase [Larsenimonas salina]
MNILITGATGFVGVPLCKALDAKGHRLLVVSRSPEKASEQLGMPVKAQDDPMAFKDEPIDAIINLAGASIAGRPWTDSRKKTLIDSRVETTRALERLCQAMSTPPKVLVSGSAMGYYGAQGEREVTEETPPNPEFAHELCQKWEDAARRIEALGVRTAIIRIGLVLERDGGTLKPMLPVYKLGLGATLGSGTQYMPWIHRTDLIRIIEFLLVHDTLEGPFNAGAPNPVTNRVFTKSLAHALHRPAPWRIPGFALKAAMGEMSRLLLTGARMKPARLEAAGFEFRYPELDGAFLAIVNGR